MAHRELEFRPICRTASLLFALHLRESLLFCGKSAHDLTKKARAATEQEQPHAFPRPPSQRAIPKSRSARGVMSFVVTIWGRAGHLAREMGVGLVYRILGMAAYAISLPILLGLLGPKQLGVWLVISTMAPQGRRAA
jgi:hypothetical protein